MDFSDKIFGIVILVIALTITGCVVTKHVANEPLYHYSEGDRIGVLRKLSKKGFFHKTYEGELMLNAGMGSVKLDTFNFSVKDEILAKELIELIGKGVKLHYDQFLIVPYSVGSTKYLITSYETQNQ